MRAVRMKGVGRFAMALAPFCLCVVVTSAWGQALDFFETSVRPILAENCFKCHGPEEQKSNLRLDHIDYILQGGDNGAALVRGEPDESAMVHGIRYTDVDFQMPPKTRLSDEAVEVLVRWITMGAPWPDEPLPTDIAEEETFDLAKRRQDLWAWQPVIAPDPPDVTDPRWSQHPIDRFILHRLEEAGLKPAAQASQRALVRRAYFDLIGLPPEPERVDVFLGDASADAWEKLIDELLASRHFGERWARHWLDLVRYADSYGHESDAPIALAWRYRDYVIRALNADVPYDQIIREHVAGDVLDDPRINPDEGYNESIIGTGFWYLFQAKPSPVDVSQDEADRIANQIDVFSKAFMGMTVACARCHEHKFDAISTEDYYALSGVLKSTRQQTAFLGKLKQDRNAALDAKRDLTDSFRGHIEGLTENDAGLDEWIQAAREVLGGRWQEGDGPEAYQTDRRFASFETEDLPDWEEGVSHFTRVHSGKAYREESALRRTALGRRSLDTRGRQGVPDLPDAELWTKPFVVTHNYIEFLLNGGIVSSNVSVNLVIDGDRVHSETSPGSGEFVRVVWDVAEYKGREALFLVLDTVDNISSDEDDDHYITIDNIVFSDSRELYEIRRPIAAVAKDAGLDAGRLVEWLEVVAKRLPYLTPGADATQDREEWFRFSGEDFGEWTTTGTAFGDGPVQHSGMLVSDGDLMAVPRGVVHSGLASHQSRGVLRSPTFILNHDAIHYRALGKNAQVRLIIDGNQMVKFGFRLFEDTILDVNTEGTYSWITQYKQIGKYRGHRVYIELADEGDGYLSVDSIVFSNSHEPPSDSDLTPHEDRSVALGAAAERYVAGRANVFDTELLNALNESGLYAIDEPLRARAEKYHEKVDEEFDPMPVLAMLEGTAMDDRVHIRGVHKNLGDEVPRRFVEAIAGRDAAFRGDGSGRLALAEQLVSEDNPLTARVMVNRVWQHLMGRGIVGSVDNFGVLGERPTHPELLDHLALRFIDEGWSIKRLIKAIMMSETYRMSSGPADAMAEEKDPTNALLHRAHLRRLEGEIIRDAMLAVSGRLDDGMYGPGIPVYIPRRVRADVANTNSSADDGRLDGEGRRSIYLKQRRNIPQPMVKAFDLPTPETTFGRRTVTNTPAQALIMMNDLFVRGQAEKWAARILAEPSPHAERVKEAYRVALARRPSNREESFLRGFFEDHAEQYEISPNEAKTDVRVWADLCHVILTLKEFIYIP